jgi:hypothetical protein
VLAFATVAATVTGPPAAGSFAGVRFTETTAAGLAPANRTKKRPTDEEGPFFATRPKATDLCTSVEFGPTVTWAENFPSEQDLELCEKTTANDCFDRSWS